MGKKKGNKFKRIEEMRKGTVLGRKVISVE